MSCFQDLCVTLAAKLRPVVVGKGMKVKSSEKSE
jgi:hypothetical protein